MVFLTSSLVGVLVLVCNPRRAAEHHLEELDPQLHPQKPTGHLQEGCSAGGRGMGNPTSITALPQPSRTPELQEHFIKLRRRWSRRKMPSRQLQRFHAQHPEGEVGPWRQRPAPSVPLSRVPERRTLQDISN